VRSGAAGDKGLSKGAPGAGRQRQRKDETVKR